MGETKLSEENILVFIWLGYLNTAAQVQNLRFLGEEAFKKSIVKMSLILQQSKFLINLWQQYLL